MKNFNQGYGSFTLANDWLSAGAQSLLNRPVARRHASLHHIETPPRPIRRDVCLALRAWKDLTEHPPPPGAQR
jgi:hypothetical protein